MRPYIGPSPSSLTGSFAGAVLALFGADERDELRERPPREERAFGAGSLPFSKPMITRRFFPSLTDHQVTPSIS